MYLLPHLINGSPLNDHFDEFTDNFLHAMWELAGPDLMISGIKDMRRFQHEKDRSAGFNGMIAYLLMGPGRT